ncbi:MAG: hypothetical protein HUU14_02085 [Dehalococcoidia bacterium]|nr:hypothetical protein [Chloroflexi bacterium CFX7]MCK6564271.1 hypothetical protein [Dehalococcoidia bacterium]NUQ54658.1 hypothetical protein [Dehalococcoidia bacterium]
MIRKLLTAPIALVAVFIGAGLGEAGYAHHPEEPRLELVRKFDPAKSEFPKGIAFDRRGNTYIGMQYLGEVWRITPNGDEEVFVKIPFSGPVGTGMVSSLGIIEERHGGMTLYATFVDVHASSATGVYRIDEDRTITRILGTETLFGNGIAIDRRGNVYFSDSVGGAIWRVRHGEPAAELWIHDALLEGDGRLGFGVPLGVGGITVDGSSLLVTVEEKSRLVRIPIRRDGSAGQPSVEYEHPSMCIPEGVAVVGRGRTYFSCWFESSLNVLDRQGQVTQLAGTADGLLGPVTLAVGPGRHGRYLYVVNQSGFIFPDPQPALYRMALPR